VQDHDASESRGGIFRGLVKARAVDLRHDSCGIIANVFGGAIILIGCDGSNIQDAVAKGTESDRRVAYISLVGEGDLQDTDVIDDRGRDGGDEEEDGGSEEEEGPRVVDDASLSHFDSIELCSAMFGGVIAYRGGVELCC